MRIPELALQHALVSDLLYQVWARQGRSNDDVQPVPRSVKDIMTTAIEPEHGEIADGESTMEFALVMTRSTHPDESFRAGALGASAKCGCWPCHQALPQPVRASAAALALRAFCYGLRVPKGVVPRAYSDPWKVMFSIEVSKSVEHSHISVVSQLRTISSTTQPLTFIGGVSGMSACM